MRVLVSTAAAILVPWSASHARAPQTSPPRVEIVAVPDGGIQPQAVIDGAGTIHLLYFKGQPAGGDLFYARRKAGAVEFSAPVPVNSESGTAIATGSVRGGQIALGRDGWIHAAWNGSKALDRDGDKLTPIWYARLAQGGRRFEPQRAIGRQTRHLDGGGSIAADRTGQVTSYGMRPGVRMASRTVVSTWRPPRTMAPDSRPRKHSTLRAALAGAAA